MLTTVINVTTPADTLVAGDGVTSLREAIARAHQENDPSVRIELQSGVRYEIDRPTILGTIFTEGTPLDPDFGDFDIRRDLVIQGNGATIDANDLGRVFEITGGVDVTFRNVTLRDGQTLLDTSGARTHLEGGGVRIDNEGGRVRFFGSRIVSNEVNGLRTNGNGDDVRGGGVFVSGGELVIDNTVLEFNDARGGEGLTDDATNDVDEGRRGGAAFGGAIYAEDATVRIRNDSVIRQNDAAGGDGGRGNFTGGSGGRALGGGVFQENGLLEIDDSLLELNEADGGSGGQGNVGRGGRGGDALGAAVHIVGDSTFATSGSEVVLVFEETTLTATDARLRDNTATGGRGGDGRPAGNGGAAWGGAVYAGDRVGLTFTRTNVLRNSAAGGRGGSGASDQRAGRGGDARGGGLASFGELLVNAGRWGGNEALGGFGGAYVSEAEGAQGGVARGGAIFTSWNNQLGTFPILDSNTFEQVNLIDTELSDNLARGGAGSDGFNGQGSNVTSVDGGSARGGGIVLGELLRIVAIVDSSIDENRAEGGRGGNFRERGTAGTGGEARGGGIHSAATEIRLTNSSLLGNTAVGGRGGNTSQGVAGDGGAAEGGAIRSNGILFVRGILNVTDPNLDSGTVTASISGNDAIGGRGGNKRDVNQSFSEDAAGEPAAARSQPLVLRRRSSAVS